MLRGYCGEALSFIEAALLKAQPNSGESYNLEIKAAAALAVMGRTGEALERVAHTPVPPVDAGWLRHGYFSFLLLVLLEQGELGEPLEHALREYPPASESGPSGPPSTAATSLCSRRMPGWSSACANPAKPTGGACGRRSRS